MEKTDKKYDDNNCKSENITDEMLEKKENIIDENNNSHITNIQQEKQDIVDDPRAIKIIELENYLSELKNKERDNLLRFKAEIDNIRRRADQDIEKAYKFSLERFIISLLPVIDNLERSIDISKKNILNVTASNNDINSIIEGIELTLQSLLNTVKKFGINIIEDIHVPFNPEIHQAMNTMETNDYNPNLVITIMQKGYILNGRLIRPAMVTVSKKIPQDNLM